MSFFDEFDSGWRRANDQWDQFNSVRQRALLRRAQQRRAGGEDNTAVRNFLATQGADPETLTSYGGFNTDQQNAESSDFYRGALLRHRSGGPNIKPMTAPPVVQANAPAAPQPPASSAPAGAPSVGPQGAAPNVPPVAAGAPPQAAPNDPATPPDDKAQEPDAYQQVMQQSGAAARIQALEDLRDHIGETYGDPDAVMRIDGAIEQLHTQAAEHAVAAFTQLAALATQLKSVPSAQRIQVAVQQLHQLNPNMDTSQLQQMILQRADANGNGTLDDAELDAFAQSTLSYADQVNMAHNQRMEALQERALSIRAAGRGGSGGGAYTGGAVGGWSESAIRMRATMLAGGDPNALTGIRDQHALAAINSMAADLLEQNGDAAGSITLRRASVHAAGRAMDQLTTTRAMVMSAEHSVRGLFRRIRELAPRINASQVPAMNQALQAWRRLVGLNVIDRNTASGVEGRSDAAFNQAASGLSDTQREYVNLIREAMTEYAKVLSGAYGAGGQSDSQIAHAMEMMNEYQNPTQLEGAIRAAEEAMDARVEGYNVEEQRLQGQIANQGGDPEAMAAQRDLDTRVQHGQYTLDNGRRIIWTEGSMRTLANQLQSGDIDPAWMSRDEARRVIQTWVATHGDGGGTADTGGGEQHPVGTIRTFPNGNRGRWDGNGWVQVQ